MPTKRHPLLSDAVAGVLIYLVALWAVQLIVPGGLADTQGKSPAHFLIAQGIDSLLLAVIPLFFIYRIYSEPVSSFGFSVRQPGRNFVIGIAAGVLLSGVSLVYGLVIEWFGISYDHSYIELFRQSSSALMSAAVVAGVAGFAPLAEEIFFRAFIFSVLRRHSSTAIAVVISASLFAIAHLSAASFLFNCFFGVALAILFHRTSSLVTPVVAHISFNAIALALSVFAENSGELSLHLPAR